jgi:hypothetical protein
MACPPKLSVGTFFQEVDDTGVLRHYWILAIAKAPRISQKDGEDALRPPELVGNLATNATNTDQSKRITWDVSAFIATDGMPATA